MRRISTTPLLFAAILLTVPGDALLAQVLPGISEDRIRAGRQEFTAETLRSVNDFLGEWKRAWAADDARAVSRFYTDEASIVLPGGERVAGQEAIETVMGERVLPASGQIVTHQLDLVASGRMAVSMGRFTFQDEEEGFIVDRSGTYVMVLMRNGRRWQIRSQVFSDDGLGTGI